MAFRLKGDRSADAGLCRLVRKELDRAIARLRADQPDKTAIHDARTSVKKIRAILRLLREELGSTYRTENDRLQSVAQSLSPVRDVDATNETLERLRGHYASVLTPATVARTVRTLRHRTRRVKAKAATPLARARKDLAESSESLRDALRRTGGFTAMRTGAVEGYRRARRAMAGIGPDTEAARFHRWRRRVKDHWYQVRLFEGLHTGARARARALERLGDFLGDAHDLTVLRATLLEAPERFGDARTIAITLGCIVKYQVLLRERALKLGHRLFRGKPGEIERSINAWWHERSLHARR